MSPKDVSTRNDAIWAGELQGQKVKTRKERKGKNIDTSDANSSIWEHAPTERTKTKFGIRGRVAGRVSNFIEIG